MPFYWARFEEIPPRSGNWFRFDTRIYLDDMTNPKDNDMCIGAVVGKNPGAALPSNSNILVLQPIALGKDKLLPTVRNRVLDAYKALNAPLPDRAYIQVLNLFYLCDPNLDAAIKAADNFQKMHGDLPPDPAEEKGFPWIWFVWGGDDKFLNPFKDRFRRGNPKPVFLGKTSMPGQYQGVYDFPPDDVLARHTQGVSSTQIVDAISEVMEESFLSQNTKQKMRELDD